MQKAQKEAGAVSASFYIISCHFSLVCNYKFSL